jgi:hypothetical protein
MAVPSKSFSILLARLRGDEPGNNPEFIEVREQINAEVLKSPQDARILSLLAVVDALLNKKDIAISEARRAVEMQPISTDALYGPAILKNLAIVYAWSNEVDLALDTLGSLTETPFGIYYGALKGEPYWEPLREDPRYEKLLEGLAPRDGGPYR